MDWITAHWLDLLQNVGIIGGMLFTARTLRIDEKGRQVENMLRVAEQHRRIWELTFRYPELTRVLKSNVDIGVAPITDAEELFVQMLILHLYQSLKASRSGLFILPEQLSRDIRNFFTLPIPAEVWEKSRLMQDASLVAFVESCFESEK